MCARSLLYRMKPLWVRVSVYRLSHIKRFFSFISSSSSCSLPSSRLSRWFSFSHEYSGSCYLNQTSIYIFYYVEINCVHRSFMVVLSIVNSINKTIVAIVVFSIHFAIYFAISTRIMMVSSQIKEKLIGLRSLWTHTHTHT